MNIENCKNLKELCDALNEYNSAHNDPDQPDVHLDSVIDLTSLPTFGGVEPACTLGVFSWDSSCLMVSDNKFEIVER